MQQRFIGLVVGTSMQKTAKVCVERLIRHKKYPTTYRFKKNYFVHDEHEKAIIGDLVTIEFCGKISVKKSFKLGEILKEARKYVHPITGQIFTAPATLKLPARFDNQKFE